MRNPPTVGPWLYFPIYCWRTDRHRPSQLVPRHRTTRHILRSSPLPLCPLNGGRVRHRSCLRPLIPPIFRIHSPLHMNKNPLWSHVCRSKSNLLPPTLLRSRRNASTILRLPRRLHPLKHSLIHRLHDLPRGSNYVPLHHLRSLRRQTRSKLSRTYSHKRGVTARLPSSLPHL